MKLSNRLKLDLYGWFPEESQDILDRLIKEHNIKTVIEVGCFVGKATAFFAERCERVWAIDTFDWRGESYLENPHLRRRIGDVLEQFEANMEFLDLRDKVTPLKMTSLEAADVLEGADLIYIDASHQYADVAADIAAWFPKARVIIAGDDYGSDSWPGVKQAVDEAPFTANRDQRLWYYVKGKAE